MKTNPDEPINGELLFQPMGNEYDGTTCVGQFTRGGLTKREHFAAMAMQGLCLKSAPDYIIGDCNAAIVERAVVIADALIEQLNKERT